MAKVISNDLERFRQDIRDVEQKILSLQETNNRMNEEIQSLTGMWEGSAHDTYMAQFEADSENMRLVLKNLHAYKKSIEEAYAKFQTCEQQVGEVIRKVQV